MNYVLLTVLWIYFHFLSGLVECHKIALVTGASDSIGSAVAKRLVEEGYKVVGLSKNPAHVKILASKLSNETSQLYPLLGEVTKENQIVHAFSWTCKNIGPISVLINAEDQMSNGTLYNGASKDWKKVLDTNVLGLSIATREAVRQMRAYKIDGHIIHINSIAGHDVKIAHFLNMFAASKYAVTALTESLRLELNRIGSRIKVGSISPGYVNRNIYLTNVDDLSPKERQSLYEYALEPEDVAEVVMFSISAPPHVQVVGLARTKHNLESLAKNLTNEKGKLHPIQGDITNETDVINAFQWTLDNVGPVGILVNAAGRAAIGQIYNGKTENWRSLLYTNFIGPCLLSREAVKQMMANDINGHIIHINSLYGHYTYPAHVASLYPASKVALGTFTETLRHELYTIGSKIKVANVSPGFVDTQFTDPFAEKVKIGASLEPKDVADAIMFSLTTHPRLHVQDIIIRHVMSDK